MNLEHSLAGALVGIMVGLTGVGGGALMTPLLILIFGFNPAVAIGTDLWFAAITKSVGGAMHYRLGTPDWQIIRRLIIGSLPAAILTIAWLGISHGGQLNADVLMKLLGAALLVTALLLPIKGRLTAPIALLRDRFGDRFKPHQTIATVASGALVGCLVSLTSVGAGALVAAILMFLYPLRLDAKSVVGSDIIHAIPLALLAAIGHFWMGNVDWTLLMMLILGSIPGIMIGSLLTNHVGENLVRICLALMLGVSAAKLLFG